MGPTAVSGTGILVTTRLFFTSMTETESENSFPTYANERLQSSPESFCAREYPVPKSRIASAASEPAREKKRLAAKQQTFIVPLFRLVFDTSPVVVYGTGATGRDRIGVIAARFPND